MAPSSPPAPSLPPSPSHRRWRWWGRALMAVALALVLAWAWRAWQQVPAGASGLEDAQWIWLQDEDPRKAIPVVFLAIADFRLDAAPASAPLVISVDGRYRAMLNGRLVGGGRVLDEVGALHRYDVAPLLLPGGNRLVLELSNGLGHGVVAARLAVDGQTVVATGDGSFQMLAEPAYGVVQGWVPVEGGQPPKVWGRPPEGRRARPPVVDLPLLAGDGPAPVVSASLQVLGPADWLVGFADPVVGILSLGIPVDGARTGFLFSTPNIPLEVSAGGDPAEVPDGAPREGASEVVIPSRSRANATAEILVLPGQQHWVDHRPRRWHTVRLVGLTALDHVEVRLGGSDDPRMDSPVGSVVTVPGVFGFAGPPTHHPLADVVWGTVRDETQRQAAVPSAAMPLDGVPSAGSPQGEP